MSYQNFELALNTAKQCNGYLDGGRKMDGVIIKAEELLGIKLSKQNAHYFRRHGFIEFFGNEIYGIVKDDFSGTYAGCAIEATLYERKTTNLPLEWLTLYFFDDGYYGYLDYSQLNNDGEPPVIMAIFDGEKHVFVKKVAEDLGDFLLTLVSGQLARQEHS